MVLDKEEHRELLLEMINAVPINGSVLDIVYELKQAILKAEVTKKDD